MSSPIADSPKRRRPWMIGAVFGLVGLALIGWLTPGPSGPVPFQSGAWRASGGEAGGDLRDRMVDDLIATRLVPGLTREQVADLLGPAEPKNYFSGSGYDAMYRLGRGGGLLPGSRFLVLDFDEQGQLLRAEVLQD